MRARSGGKAHCPILFTGPLALGAVGYSFANCCKVDVPFIQFTPLSNAWMLKKCL